jgi:hypothetical protein
VIAKDLMAINIGKTVIWEREPAGAHALKDK